MYSRQEYLNSTDCRKQNLARDHEGLAWNYAIAPTIDRDLHARLLDVQSSDVLQFIQLLPLIRSGYFGTVIEILKGIIPESDTLAELKTWAISALTEAREV